MTHARPYRPTRRQRLLFAVLSRWPLRFWYSLPEAKREWWVEEYHRRHPLKPGRLNFD